MKWLIALCAGLGLAACGMAAEKSPAASDPIKLARQCLKQSAQCREKLKYGRKIAYLGLGYAAGGQTPVEGVAVGPIKTYANVTGIVLVRKVGEEYQIAQVLIPDLDKVRDPEKRQKAEAALEHLQGQTVKSATEPEQSLDALTGATKLANAIVGSFSALAQTVAKEIAANPDWPLQPLAPQP